MTWPDSLAGVSMSDVPEVSVDDLAARLSDVAVIDVRHPDEYRSGHVRAAHLIPLAEVPDHLDELAALAGQTGRLHMICRSGARSAIAGEFLQQQGVPAVNVAGGMLAWVEAGHDIVTGDSPA